jgi:hypothetical protein
MSGAILTSEKNNGKKGRGNGEARNLIQQYSASLGQKQNKDKHVNNRNVFPIFFSRYSGSPSKTEEW